MEQSGLQSFMPDERNPLQCPKCLKKFKRRDLVMRHRRRCLQKNPTTRQKACNACVQAKARCSYSQPICARCAKRGMSCEYAARVSKVTDSANDSDRTAARTTEPGGQLDLWGSDSLPWSLDLADIPLDVISDNHNPALPNADSNLVPPSQHDKQYYDVLGIPDIVVVPNPTFEVDPDLSRSDPSQCLRLLMQYPMLLMKDDFHCPFAHRSLFSEDVPDMTVLAHTPVAICCASGLLSKQSAPFVKRTMNAQRHSIIEAYPDYTCMEQWDALHAMLLYEILDLSPVEEGIRWKQRPRGLVKTSFLARMAREYSEKYVETYDASLLPSPGTWTKWVVAESARRTVFLANIVNFLSKRDSQSKKLSVNYQPLGDELILNMPLPCSQTLWAARTEEEWEQAIATAPKHNDPFSIFMDNEDTSQLSLRSLFSIMSEDDLRVRAQSTAGFGDSDQLRAFIVLCALEQFGQIRHCCTSMS
ncbi:hypothetical protein ASPVEDRAFT_77576 [Aspergillus versicolor CBS 583.65]|uniref:Zn(2)-C6 fungal-type domain-containing protein n=1 Tax=Aspergillus versicolor CBS 583.65 TaxID=1036611 RepID=A0A1L9P2Z7_ASPVE|nr:uncharacterized protein ASPVEDRAFT_77576 [Aspergillus versicolor CBS 583.65]OJI95794.1 hypothetical protein ASPVEDRAFT_77576 [Aspergillus versicolor CBS 583.65]